MKTTFLLTFATVLLGIESVSLSQVPEIIIATILSGGSYVFWAWVQYFVRKKFGANVLPPNITHEPPKSTSNDAHRHRT